MSITPTEEVGLKIDEALKTFHKDYRKVNLIVIHESYMAREDLDDLMRQVHREGLLNEYHIISSSKEEMKDEAIVNNTGDIRIRIHRDPDLNQRQVDQYFAIIVMNMICRIQPQNVGSVSILADAKQFRPLCEFISKDYGITCSFV
jgi:hypothetical protein